MPYTRIWTNNTPLGTRSANEIDNSIRELRVDVAQRMDDLTDVGAKWSTNDPVSFPANLTAFKYAKLYDYNDFLGPGAKATDAGNIREVLLLNLCLQTNGSSVAQINFNLLAEDFNPIQNNVTPFFGLIRGTQLFADDYAFLLFANIVNPRIINYNVRNSEGGLFANRKIQGDVLFFFTENSVVK